MKIAYFHSVYTGIYKYLDQGIVHGFKKLNIDIIEYFPPYTQKKIQSVLEVSFDFVFTLFGRGRKDEIKLIQHIQSLRGNNTSIIGWFCEDPYYIKDTRKYIHYFDLIYTVEKCAVNLYQSYGHERVYFLPLGFDPTVYYPQPVDDVNYESTICLVGHPYSNRIELIENIIRKTPWDITLIGGKWGTSLKKWIDGKRINCINRWLPPEKLPLYYTNAKIVLNPHRPIDQKMNHHFSLRAESPNNKCFEITASGAFQICDHRKDLERLFEPYISLPTFTSNMECIELIKHYLDVSTVRKSEAEAASKVVHDKHTFEERLKVIISNV